LKNAQLFARIYSCVYCLTTFSCSYPLVTIRPYEVYASIRRSLCKAVLSRLIQKLPELTNEHVQTIRISRQSPEIDVVIIETTQGNILYVSW